MQIDKKDEIGSPNRYILENETYAIIGAAMEVYYKLGNGFAEPVYQEALGIELEMRDVVFEPQKRLHIEYKGRTLEKGYIGLSLFPSNNCRDQGRRKPVSRGLVSDNELFESERVACWLTFQFWQPWKNGNETGRNLRV